VKLYIKPVVLRGNSAVCCAARMRGVGLGLFFCRRTGSGIAMRSEASVFELDALYSVLTSRAFYCHLSIFRNEYK